jgi:uncharacterized protein YfaS (alpha-2-macroglobulin family)
MRFRLVLAAMLALTVPAAVPPEYETLKTEAEKLFADGSFARAREAYQRAEGMDLPPAEKRWVEFRLADTQWRSQAATQTADTTKLDQARRQLEALIRDITRVEDHDRVWAEVQESLGDFSWTRRNNNNWGEAWPHYQQALDWWAGAGDIELARQRYLAMVWRMARPPQVEPYYYYGYWGNNIPLEILENALKIAQTDNDKAHAHYLIAMTLRNQGGDWEQRVRVPEEFEAALKSGKKTEWYDDALYNYAEWMMNQGRTVPLKDGNWRQEPDYVNALELFRRLVTEFEKGETRYWEQAQNQIRNITDPQLSVGVQNIFLPDSEIQYFLNWRNVKRIELALYPVELNRDVKLREQEQWLQSIELGGVEKIKSWSRDTKDAGDYKPGNEVVRLEGKLKPGAYVLEAKGGGKSARDLILVTDATLVMKASGKQALLFFCNALNSEPLGGAKFKLWERWHDGRNWHIRQTEKVADKDGIAVFDLSRTANNNLELFASAILKDRQAFSPGNSYWYGRQEAPWRIYAFTDRPAYRPKETVQWKFIARRYNGSVYSTPSEQRIEFQIQDQRGAKVKEDKVTLNAFGSAWGSLELTETMPLGEYRITFWDEGKKQTIGNATLFRLEEYKLPEFKVSVQTPEENGIKKTFRVGEKVEVNIQADYYFGGPVANANVEVLVHQNPFYHYWHQPREYAWFYEDMDSTQGRWGRWYGGEGQIIKRETLKTDATGKAALTFETPRNAGQDFEYRIEARVTDSSRREITGSGNVRVTRQRYYVYPQPGHNLYRPQDKVTVEFKALDANEQPVQTDGEVKVTRDYWYEIWLDPEGQEVKGEQLKALQRAGAFPPAPKPNQTAWRLKFRGYEHDDVLTKMLKTDTNGVAELSFTPEREGYYRVAWSSEDKTPNSKPQTPNLVRAETTVWVATGATTELGYRHGGMEIIVDKDTFRVGQKAPVMLVVPTNDRHVLFTVEGEDLYNYQLVHLDGTVKLIELPIEEKHVPNIFLSAVLVSDRQIFVDTKQVIVPPTKNFLTVEVKPDRPQYQPREEGTFTVTTRDESGKAVSAEVAFGLVDESVFYIQQDYAGDPRQFYFGTKRPQVVQMQSTMNQKSYARLVEGEKEQLMDDRELERRRGGGINEKDEQYVREVEAKLGRDVNGLGDDLARYAEGQVSGGALTKSVNRMALAQNMPAAPPTSHLLSLADKRKAAEEPAAFPGQEPAVQVRTDFRSTVLWQPDLVTDKDGKASVKVKYPDSLTGWKATARVASPDNQFGIAASTTRTKMPLIVRLEAPRFFLVGDTVTLSAVLNNNTEQAMEVKVGLDSAGGLEVRRAGDSAPYLKVPANGEVRADWVAEIKKPGEVKLKVTGKSDKYADAMEKSYPVYEHGIEKFIAKSGKAQGNDITVKLDLPKERKADSTTLVVQVTPSMAVTMLDALPYLIDYPYGCTEQTMSRFLPAAITAKTLRDLGLQPEDIMGRAFGGIEQSSAAATHPKGKKDLAELDKIVKASLDRLYDFQHADGGWGWWKDGESDHWMTAYVVWGLTLARDAGVKIKDGVLNRGEGYLDKTLVEEELNYDMQAWMLHALAVCNSSLKKGQPSKFQAKAFDNLWTNREKLNAYTRALLALAAHHSGKTGQAKILIQNLENGVKMDERPDASVLILGAPPANNYVQGTAHWGEDGIYWRWSDGGVEATAFALRALLAIDPQNKLVEPVTNWLIKNRRGAQWNSTRDTAIVVLAMNDYLRVTGELKPELEYELSVNGTSIAKKKVSGADVFNAPSRFAIEAKLIRDVNEIRIKRKSGDGPIYFAVEGKFFNLEEPIAPAGNEIFVKRDYYKLVGRPTLLKGYVYDKQPLKDGETVRSGERVETLITIEAKNNYEYLVFEDLKPSGLEALEVRSGESLYARELKSGALERSQQSGVRSPEPGARSQKTEGKARVRRPAARPARQPGRDETDFTGRTRWVYQELRDRKVALFLDKLPEGVWEIRYDLRAEVPGEFHALPVTGYAMYVPEIRCNGAEVRIKVEEAKPM